MLRALLAALVLLGLAAPARADSVVFLERAHRFRSRLIEHGDVVGEREGLFVPSSRGLVEIRVVAREVTLPWCDGSDEGRPEWASGRAHVERVVAMRGGVRSVVFAEEAVPEEGAYEARARVMGIVGSRVFLTMHRAESSCGMHPDWGTQFVVFDVETMANVNVEQDADVQRWVQHHVPARTCEEGCNCDPLATLTVLYPRFTGEGELRATGVYLWREESYVCTSGEWGSYFSSEPVHAAAPAAWARAYQPMQADARIAMEGQRGRLLGATPVNAQSELRAEFTR